MNLNTDSWHYKVYTKYLEIRSGYKLGEAYYNYFKGENEPCTLEWMLWLIKRTKIHNLCVYMRVVMFWGPLLLFFKSAPAMLLTTILATLGVIYFELFIATGIAIPIIVFISGIMIMALLAVTILVAVGVIVLLLNNFVLSPLKQKMSGKIPEPKMPETLSLVWEYIKAKKKKICPMLTFDKGE